MVNFKPSISQTKSHQGEKWEKKNQEFKYHVQIFILQISANYMHHTLVNLYGRFQAAMCSIKL